MDSDAAGQLLALADPDVVSESELEWYVARVLRKVYGEYDCVVFGGTFCYDERAFKPDLALVAKDRSHWFVIEVELTSHSLEHHVLPQVRAFRYGIPQADCVGILARELKISRDQAETLVRFVPHSVAVIANKTDNDWAVALWSHGVQMLTVLVFKSATGGVAIEVDGTLEVVAENLGFARYSATDRSLRFPRGVRIPDGKIEINDPTGVRSTWTVKNAEESVWITKDAGVPDIEHGSCVQLVLTYGKGVSMRRTT